MYVEAVGIAFQGKVDYGMLIKQYVRNPDEPATRYSPAKCVGAERRKISGEPTTASISTSHVERQNLTQCGWGCAG